MSLYTHRFLVTLHDTDAAGVLFFAHLLRHAHDAYEAMMAASGASLSGLIEGGALHLPIVHCEADYLAPIRHGDTVEVVVEAARVGGRSFSLRHVFHVGGRRVATAETVHVAVDPQSENKIPLPENIRLIFINKEIVA